LKENHALGLPLSFVVATIPERSCLGCVIRQGLSHRLVPIQIGVLQFTTQWGFTYFDTTLNEDEASWIMFELKEKKEDHPSFVNYGHILPHISIPRLAHDYNYSVRHCDGRCIQYE
jgi:hypothetical protein